MPRGVFGGGADIEHCHLGQQRGGHLPHVRVKAGDVVLAAIWVVAALTAASGIVVAISMYETRPARLRR